MKNNQQIQESYWPRLASQPLQFFLRIHQGQGLSALHLKRGSTPPSRWSLKAKQQAVWNVGTIAPALYNLSRKRHVIQMCCFNNVRSLTHESSPQLKDVCMDLHRSVTPWLDSSCGRSILEQNSASLLNKKKTGSVLLSVIPDQIFVHIYNKKSIFRYSINMYNI